MPPLSTLIGVDWLNQNALRKFPLSDEATALDITASFALPDSLIVDLIFPVTDTNGYNPDGFHISKVSVFAQGLIIDIGYLGASASGQYTTTPVPVGTVSVAAQSHTPNRTYFVQGIGDFTQNVGKITLGDLSEIMATAGVYQFDMPGARLIATCFRPDVRNVSAIRLVNNSDISDPISGVVYLIAGSNIKLTPSSSSGGSVIDAVRIDAVGDASTLNTDCGCTNDRLLPPPITRINGVPPDSNGNFTLQGNACIVFNPGTASLTISDVCSEPCCGSPELDRLSTDQQNLNRDAHTMQNALDIIQARITQLEALQRAIEAAGVTINY